MADLQPWCRVTLHGPDGAVLSGWLLDGPGNPDLDAVEAVARFALAAKRLGGHLTLAEVSSPMRELLELAGLDVEAEGQPEHGEESFRIEEVE